MPVNELRNYGGEFISDGSEVRRKAPLHSMNTVAAGFSR